MRNFNYLFILSLTITIVLASLTGGCSDEKAITHNSSITDSMIDLDDEGLPIEFYHPADTSLTFLAESNGSNFHSAMNLLAMCVSPITQYWVVNESWPASWDQVFEYMPFLPVTIGSGESYIFGNYEEYGGHAPVNAIIAQWDQNGPTLLVTLQPFDSTTPGRSGCFPVSR